MYSPPNFHVLASLNCCFSGPLSDSFGGRAALDWKTQILKTFIDRHPAKVKGSLEGLCKHLGLPLSDRQARRLFSRDSAGLGIRSYAKNRRLIIAATKLTEQNIPIKCIALDAGYQSACHFARSFKHVFQMNPMEFRKLWITGSFANSLRAVDCQQQNSTDDSNSLQGVPLADSDQPSAEN